MPKFLALSLAGGKRVYVNPDHITHFYFDGRHERMTTVCLTNGYDPYDPRPKEEQDNRLYVSQQTEEIAQMLEELDVSRDGKEVRGVSRSR